MLFQNIDWIILTICIVFIVAFIFEVAYSVDYCNKLAKVFNEYEKYQELPKDQRGQRVNTSIFNKSRTRSFLHFIPTLLTALGILGTFFGINKGLGGIDLTSVDTTDSLLENSKQLLGGMKIAFQTSLWGLGGASLFILLIACCEWWRVKHRQGLIPQILAISNQDNELDKLDTIAQNTTKLSNFDSQNIGKEIGAAINPILMEIRNNLRDQQKDLTKNLIDVIKVDLIQPVVTTIKHNNQVTRESSQAVLQSMGGDIQDHQYFWQYYCEQILRRKGIFPNPSLTRFQINSNLSRRYDNKIGLPPPNDQQLQEREWKLIKWRQQMRL